VRLVPDNAARYSAWLPRAATPLDMIMSDIAELDGRPWMCCPRSFLKSALADFTSATGCEFIAAFEHEFQILGAPWQAAPSFAISALRRADPFGPELLSALTEAGVEPEVLLAEYGRDQFEITAAPAPGLVAADRAVFLREVVREQARLYGWRASFAPKTVPAGVGNGVHVHFSFRGSGNVPAAYDEEAPGRLSTLARSFAAGVLRHMPALTAFTAPSPISGLRLAPHHWSASYTWLGEQDRESSLRICPVSVANPGKQYNLEYRAADATASPHLALGVLIRAGLAGIRENLPAPTIFAGDPGELSDTDRVKRGLFRLPATLANALSALERDSEVSSWFDPKAFVTYTGMKRMELELCEGLDAEALCTRYATIY
jgi:glutamine synthetase